MARCKWSPRLAGEDIDNQENKKIYLKSSGMGGWLIERADQQCIAMDEKLTTE